MAACLNRKMGPFGMVCCTRSAGHAGPCDYARALPSTGELRRNLAEIKAIKAKKTAPAKKAAAKKKPNRRKK